MNRKKVLKNIVIITSLASTLMFAGISNISISFADVIKLVNTSVLNVRSGAGTNYSKIGSLTQGTKVNIISESNGWSKINYNGKIGYISSQYVSEVSSNPAPETNKPSNPTPDNNTSGNTIKEVNTNVLNVRSGAGTNYSKIGSLTQGTRVSVISESNGWSKINYNGKVGYVSSQYLSKVSSNPKSVILDVPRISQYPDLPMGCEATSLAQLLRYRGIPVTKTQMAKEMPLSPNKNPNLGFVGSQYEKQEGIFQTIYPPALESLAKKYRPNSADITGASVEELEKELIKGNPSIVWVTAYCRNPEMGYWYEGTPDQLWVAKNLHVTTLTGFDEDYYYLTDPGIGKLKIKKSQFKYVYDTIGKKAVVVR
ncbi:SH3 domain-containing protein [uncultured Intestinibacter sp.]|uniref:SH3 domain-containing protein n=1 Tax=uncultured Intestinibacter sp. TaxID=1505659 RepID=UPI0027DE9DFD|nr:SH3 domain-containing protein [uncultured Intestinibacter sp.]